MSHAFNSINESAGLKESHQKRRKRSIEIGKQAIDLLIKKGSPITFTTIVEQSKEIDTDGKGIHHNTIRTNEVLYEYYKQHSKTYKQKTNSKSNISIRSITVENIEFHKIKPNRNKKNLQRNYMKF